MSNTIRSRLGECSFVASYGLMALYFVGGVRGKPHYADLIHVGLALQWIGHALGGRRWGGLGLLEWMRGPVRARLTAVYLAWSALWAVAAVLRYRAFRPDVQDLGYYLQILDGLARGVPFLSHLAPPPASWTDHQEFTYLILAPLMRLSSGPELILIAQAFLLYLPGLLLGLWVAREWRDGRWAWAAWFAWMGFSGLSENTLWDFHPSAVNVGILAFWTWALVRGRAGPFVLASVLVGLGKENLNVVAAAGVVVYVFAHRVRGRALAGWAALVALHLIAFKWETSSLGVGIHVSRYPPELGASAPEILWNAITKPWRWIALFAEPRRIHFLLDLLWPLSFAVFFAGRFALLWVPPFLIHALSGWPPQQLLRYHYVLDVWPVAAVVALVGWRNVAARVAKPMLLPAIAITNALWCLPASPVMAIRDYYSGALAMASVRAEVRAELDAYAKRCGSGGVVVATSRVFSHLDDLTRVYWDDDSTLGRPDYQAAVSSKCVAWVLGPNREANARLERRWESCPICPLSLYLQEKLGPEALR